MGLQYSEYKTEDNIKVLVSYYKSQDKRLIFSVEVENQSGQSVLVDATKFYLVGYDFHGNVIDTVKAMNPERKLLRLDVEGESLRASESNQRIGMALESISQVANTIDNPENLSASERELANDLQENELAHVEEL